SRGAIEPTAFASPSEAASLGSEIDDHVLAEEITGESDVTAAEPGTPATPATTDAVDVTLAGTTPAWLEDEVLPGAGPDVPQTRDRLDTDIDTVTTNVPSTPDAAWSAAAIETGSVVGEWTDAHTIPSSDEIMGLAPESPAAMPVPPSLGDAPQTPA